MDPPFIHSTVGCRHGCGLAPAWLLLLLAPSTVCSSLVSSVSSLAHSTVISTLGSVSRPPAGCLSSSWTSTSFLCWLPALRHPSAISCPFFLCDTRSRLLRGGRIVTVWSLLLCFPVLPPCFSSVTYFPVCVWLCYSVQVCLVIILVWSVYLSCSLSVDHFSGLVNVSPAFPCVDYLSAD